MLRRLQQYLSPMSSMRIDPLTQTSSSLQQKLHTITQYLLNASKQFDAWMELQNINKLHLALYQLYASAEGQEKKEEEGQGKREGEGQGEGQPAYQGSNGGRGKRSEGKQGTGRAEVTEEDLVNIIQFYTMLLINCKDELLICKLVSDSFIIQLCETPTLPISLRTDLQPYRINLIKSYMNTITSETIKYMILEDRFKIFQTCICLYSNKIGSGTVQFTTISNILLNVIKKVDLMPYLWHNVWKVEGLQLGLLRGFEVVGAGLKGNEQVNLENQQNHTTIEQIKDQNTQQPEPKQKPVHTHPYTLDMQKMETLQQIILFLVQIRTSITQPHLCKQIQQFSYLYLQEMLDIIGLYENEEHWIYAFSTLFSLFKNYSFQQDAVEVAIPKFMHNIVHGLATINYETITTPQSELICRQAFILCTLVCSKYSHLSQRSLSLLNLQAQKHSQILEYRHRILELMPKLLNNFMDYFERTSSSLYVNYIKWVLLTAFQIKLAVKHGVKEKSVNLQNVDRERDGDGEAEADEQVFLKLDQALLELFLSFGVELKKVMSKSELWGNIMKWYQDAANKVSQNLLLIPDIFQHKPEQPSLSIMTTYQYLKSFRYMITQQTSLCPKSIKQQKFYHNEFSSIGLSLQPGKTSSSTSLNLLYPCIFHHNHQQLPVIVVEDRECFVIGVKVEDSQVKILVNIRFKDIDSLVYAGNLAGLSGGDRKQGQQPRYVRINLRGSQQILLQFSNAKIIGNAFKQYIIKSRDMARQRQLTFLNLWIKNYQADAQKSLQNIKKKLKKDSIVL